MRFNCKYLDTPPNPLFLEGELIPYISMAYSLYIKLTIIHKYFMFNLGKEDYLIHPLNPPPAGDSP
jgi:hypothetical protein